jgi:hypothetical protein
MQRNRKKLALDKETIRSLANAELERIAGGISGPRICNSNVDHCPTRVTCNTRDLNCPSSPGTFCAC